MQERNEQTRFKEKGKLQKREVAEPVRQLAVKYQKELAERKHEENTAETSAVEQVEETAIHTVSGLGRELLSAYKEKHGRKSTVFRAGKRRAEPQGQRAQTNTAKTVLRKAMLGIGETAAAVLEKVTTAVKSGKNAESFLMLAGGGMLLPIICTVVLVGGILCSPFGILFVNEPSQEAVPLGAAVAEIQSEFSAQLEILQDGDYDRIEIEGVLPDWCEVVAVFACEAASAENDMMVATLLPEQVEVLREVFWDMCSISSNVEEIEHDGWTERVLSITISAKTAEDMGVAYRFNDEQNSALTELLAGREEVEHLLQDLRVSQMDARELIENLPDGLSPERRAVVETACQLVGKVNYFWGGKSLVIGWDDRWGQLKLVTADGSPSANTYRPFGLDCSGFVDWVFYNATDGEYILGHGGGAIMQHQQCSDISWSAAQPGDLVFYPKDSHVGIVGGKDENGNLLIIHCTSGGYNNVVITEQSGFNVVAQPNCIDD